MRMLIEKNHSNANEQTKIEIDEIQCKMEMVRSCLNWCLFSSIHRSRGTNFELKANKTINTICSCKFAIKSIINLTFNACQRWLALARHALGCVLLLKMKKVFKFRHFSLSCWTEKNAWHDNKLERKKEQDFNSDCDGYSVCTVQENPNYLIEWMNERTNDVVLRVFIMQLICRYRKMWMGNVIDISFSWTNHSTPDVRNVRFKHWNQNDRIWHWARGSVFMMMLLYTKTTNWILRRNILQTRENEKKTNSFDCSCGRFVGHLHIENWKGRAHFINRVHNDER